MLDREVVAELGEGRRVGAGQQVAAVRRHRGPDVAGAEQREHVLDVGAHRHHQPVGAGGELAAERRQRRWDTSAFSVDSVTAWSP